MKKRLLFVIDSLGIGGAEKSLVTLLGLLDYSRFEVDLQMFAYGGPLQRFVPSEVNMLPPLNYTRFLSMPIWRQLCRPSMFAARLMYSLRIRRRGLLNSDKVVLYWRSIGEQVERNRKSYDVAIAYAQGVPTFYTIDKVSARRKFAWVNTDYRIKGVVRDYQRGFYDALDAIVPVSEFVREVFSGVYPEFADKMRVVRDIIDASFVEKMSRLQPDKNIDVSRPVLMTAGRLDSWLKGYDLALQAAKILRDRGVDFRWYAIGDGCSRQELERDIADNGLEEYFILAGATDNPYACIARCDVYVQPSRHEGFGLAIAEARILDKPVVCTNFEGCTMQIADGVNGLIASFEPSDIADCIERLLTDKKLYSDIRSYLERDKKGNIGELERFYSLIEQ